MKLASTLQKQVDLQPATIAKIVQVRRATGIEACLERFEDNQILEEPADERVARDLVAFFDPEEVGRPAKSKFNFNFALSMFFLSKDHADQPANHHRLLSIGSFISVQ